MFCKKCGNQIMDGEQFCSNCGEPVPTGIPQEVQVSQGQMAADTGMPVKKSKAPLVIAIAVVFTVLIVAFMVVGGYDLVKTKEFKRNIETFARVETECDGLGKYKNTYRDLYDEALGAASNLAFWQYEDLAGEMKSLGNEIREMNDAVAEYRKKYEACVARMEPGQQYVMDGFEDEYARVKKALEDALEDFDEKQCKKKAEEFDDLVTKIIEQNEKMASQAVVDARDIKDSFNSVNAHAFERYMINSFVSRLEADQEDADYIKLQEDYAQLKEWSDKFYAATRAGQQVEKFIQADVSESDKVKLYISPTGYDEYNFKLEDFVIYEQNGNVWDECKAIDISQIKGALTMDLVLDVSGSMRDDFLTMQYAVEGFVNSTYADTALGLSTIGSIYERYQEFTTDKQRIISSVWDLECYGLTSLYQSLYSSVVYTASAEGARCVVAFTDGHNEPYGSGYDYDAQDVIDVSNFYQVPVYIIGLGSYVYSSELREIAEATGGAYYDRISVSDLQDVYTDIYEAQGRVYQLTFGSKVSNRVNRDIYVLYADSSQKLGVRLEEELNAEALNAAYETAMFSGDDLGSFYTDSRYLSSDDLSKLGHDTSSLEKVQTIINIYYAKNGYRFGDGENGQKQLQKMISLGVIDQNGTLDGDTVSAIIKNNTVLYQNFCALYNYRYELVYTAALDIYQRNPYISYEDMRTYVHNYYGEENDKRFDPVTKAAWNAIKSN